MFPGAGQMNPMLLMALMRMQQGQSQAPVTPPGGLAPSLPNVQRPASMPSPTPPMTAPMPVAPQIGGGSSMAGMLGNPQLLAALKGMGQGGGGMPPWLQSIFGGGGAPQLGGQPLANYGSPGLMSSLFS